MVKRFARGRVDKGGHWPLLSRNKTYITVLPLFYYMHIIIPNLSQYDILTMTRGHLYSWWLQHLSNKLCCWSWSFYAKCNIQIFSGWSKLCKSLLRVHSWRKSWKIITSFISYRLDNIRRDYIDPDQNKIVRIRIQQKSVNPIGSGALDVRFCSNLFT